MTEAVKKFMERCPVAVSTTTATGSRNRHRVVLMPTKRAVAVNGPSYPNITDATEEARVLRTWLEDVLEEFEASAARKPAAEGEGKG